ncbi:hypothetical protein [Sandarakinorhabdus sp.]|uniref:hypothetical protein n=1 Tax=Sandarakinorhabdus sp. TaxID=1916663 RepID=UPI00286E90AF|nr:hypothetical protein [Sandarakinorhabdus sp.]
MPNVIVFGFNYKDHEGVSQNAALPMPAGMSYAVADLVAVLVAAGAANGAIGGVVGAHPVVHDIGAFKAGATMVTIGLLTMVAPLPANAPYHAAIAAKTVAVAGQGYLEVVESMHISHSCPDPHMTVIIRNAQGAQVGQKIHVCAAANGNVWQFTHVG